MDNKETVSLKHYIDQRINDVLAKIDFINKSEIRATDKALSSINERLEVMNGFRAQMGDQQRTYVPRAELSVILEGIQGRLEKMEESMAKLVAQRVGYSQGIGTVALIAGLIATLVVLLSRILEAC